MFSVLLSPPRSPAPPRRQRCGQSYFTFPWLADCHSWPGRCTALPDHTPPGRPGHDLFASRPGCLAPELRVAASCSSGSSGDTKPGGCWSAEGCQVGIRSWGQPRGMLGAGGDLGPCLLGTAMQGCTSVTVWGHGMGEVDDLRLGCHQVYHKLISS